MPKAKKPLVIVTRKLPDNVELRMRELFDARFNPDDKPMTQAQLAEAVKTADVLVPTVTDRIDASVLSKSGDQLKLIANFGNGVDNIDVATAVQRGITVTNTPGVLTEDTADMTMALVLAVPRRLVEGVAAMEEEKKRRESGQNPPGVHGTVLAVNQAYNFVVLNMGDRQGVVPNSEMLVLRQGALIGKIRISSVEPTTSIGDIITNSLARGVQVQPGDIVVYAGSTNS